MHIYLTLILILFGTVLAFTNHFLFMVFMFICFCLLINIIVDAVSSIIENEKDIDK